MKEFLLWQNKEDSIKLKHFEPKNKISEIAIIIFAGGAYRSKAEHEGDGYAKFLASKGYNAFVVDYHVFPYHFPQQLLDARRAIRYVRFNADKFGVSKEKIYVMGSSAGGHLASLVSTYLGEIDGEGVDEIDNEDYLPNGQILCYPVISSSEEIGHLSSFEMLLGENYNIKDKFSTDKLINKTTPKAFIWHTSSDPCVDVRNSLIYAEKLKEYDIPFEMHIFPIGRHGLGLATEEEPYVSKWSKLLLDWIKLNDN